jgi:hypothetical protein
MRTWQVHLLKNGAGKDVIVQAQSQHEAHKLAESQNPGYKASSSMEKH